MRTYIKWYLVFKHKEIFQSIIAFENHLNSTCGKILISKSSNFTLEFKWVLAQKWQTNTQLFFRDSGIILLRNKHLVQKYFDAFINKMNRIRIFDKNLFQKINFFIKSFPTVIVRSIGGLIRDLLKTFWILTFLIQFLMLNKMKPTKSWKKCPKYRFLAVFSRKTVKRRFSQYLGC